jgi:integrase/recombinase XerD
VNPVSVNTYISFLNAFLCWMQEEGYVGQFFTLKKLKTDLQPVKIFKDDDAKRIIEFKPRDIYEWRLWVMVCMLLDTGIRSTECTTLRISDVNLDQLTIIVSGKGQKDRFVPISMEMRKIIYQYIKKFKITQGYRFPTERGTAVSRRNFIRDITTFCNKLGIMGARTSPQTFQYYFAVSYLRRDGDIYSLSRILGHTSVKVTEVYLGRWESKICKTSSKGSRRMPDSSPLPPQLPGSDFSPGGLFRLPLNMPAFTGHTC